MNKLIATLCGVLLLIVLMDGAFQAFGWGALFWIGMVVAFGIIATSIQGRSAARKAEPLLTRRRIAELEAAQGIPVATQGACEACGEPLVMDAKFCSYCRTPTVHRLSFCEECGTRNPADAKWCAECGALLASDAPGAAFEPDVATERATDTNRPAAIEEIVRSRASLPQREGYELVAEDDRGYRYYRRLPEA